MILSNVEIFEALDAGDIKIIPEPRRTPTLEKPETAFDTTSVNLTLSPDIVIPEKDQPFSFDLRKGGLAGFIDKISRNHQIDRDGGWNLQPGQFILGRTKERIELPLNPDRPNYAGRVEGKSSRARCGLLVHFTAPTIHAGFKGTITLELINFGAHAICLWPGMEICQLIFERVHGVPTPAPSQFQGQNTASGAKAEDVN